jgi:hypothetical protein
MNELIKKLEEEANNVARASRQGRNWLICAPWVMEYLPLMGVFLYDKVSLEGVF